MKIYQSVLFFGIIYDGSTGVKAKMRWIFMNQAGLRFRFYLKAQMSHLYDELNKITCLLDVNHILAGLGRLGL